MDDTKSLPNLLAVAREFYGRLVYTHKVHEKEREICSCKVKVVKWLNIILVAITAILAVFGAIYKDQWLLIITSIFGAISTAFVVYQLSFIPEKNEADHRAIAKQLLSLRDIYLILIEKIHSRSGTLSDLQKELEELQNRVLTIYQFAPDTGSKAYREATKAIKKNDELTFSNEEIDQFLPEALRFNSNK